MTARSERRPRLLVARNLLHGHSVADALRRVIGKVTTTSRLVGADTSPDFLRFVAPRPIPAMESSTAGSSFAACCDARAEQLLAAHERLHIMWSGGIDSTTALVALLRALPVNERDRLVVYLSSHSIAENPTFYHRHVAGRLTMRRTVDTASLYDEVVVTGELGDQLFGSDLMLQCTRRLGFDSLALPHADTLPRLFANLAGDLDLGRAVYGHFAPIADQAPFRLDTAAGFLWWWNFSQKWQHVKFRHMLYEYRGDYRPLFGRVAHFFEADAFQRWSMAPQNQALKLGSRIDTYKMPAKRYVVDYTRDDAYLAKLKVGSLCKVFRHAPIAAVTEDGLPVDQAGLRAFLRDDQAGAGQGLTAASTGR